MEIYQKLIEIFNDNLDTEISDDISATLETYDINSIAFIKIIVAIEDAFDIEFDNKNLDIRSFNTIKDIETYVKEKLMDCSRDT